LRVGDWVAASVDEGRRRQIMRHHTATHLLNRALEELLDRRNLQRGSLVAADHTTFDFPLDRPLSSDELARLQRRVNEQVRAALPLRVQVLPYEEAIGTGATHLFEEKYGDQVRVVCLGDWSCEFCGGTHTQTSADVGFALITSETSVGQGFRRIDMTVGESAEQLVRRRLGHLNEVARVLGVGPEAVGERVAELQRELREVRRQAERLRDEARAATVRGGDEGPRRRQASVPLILETVEAEGFDDLLGWADRYLEALGGSGVVGVANDDIFAIKVSRDLSTEHKARELALLLGQGGGSPQVARGKLTKPAEEAFQELEATLR
ncbi:MAG: hypothetical protein J2P45_19230, partial [Candidatus Dormibacteraeota bacterium]|nr:hypothetical protein [Candidatus Dormibacteraeota bacterium]